MSKLNISYYKCDRCYKQTTICTSTQIHLGKEMDPSGNGYNNITQAIDLCEICIQEIVAFAQEKGLNILGGK